MRKIITIVFVLLFLLTPAFADNSATTSAAPSVGPTPVGYTLPYPGLLPGNPLYYFKVARDKIVELFITDPEKKSKFYLLQADKHLEAGILLWDQKRFDESEAMISKGENYLDMAVGRAAAAKQAGEANDEVLMDLSLSSRKHQEVIKGLADTASSSVKDKLEIDLQKAADIEKSVSQLQQQNKPK